MWKRRQKDGVREVKSGRVFFLDVAAALLDSQQAWLRAQDVLKNKTVSILVWRETGLAPVANEEQRTTEGQSERESVFCCLDKTPRENAT